MKTLLVSIYLLICVLGQEYDGSFWDGFEKGYSIRNKVYGHFDYRCPDIEVDFAEL